MNIYIPYTYIIGWTTHNRYYYGVQYGKKANPANLWRTYFTSSKYVKKFREEHGEPDVIQIRQCFTDALKAKQWEEKVLLRLFSSKKNWLNKKFGNSFKNIIMTDEIKAAIGVSNSGKHMPLNTKLALLAANTGRVKSKKEKEKLSKSLTGRKMSDEWRTKNSIGQKRRIEKQGKNNFEGKYHTEESKQKMRIKRLGKNHTEETKTKIKEATRGENNPMFGKKHKQSSKDKISDANKGRKQWITDGTNNLFIDVTSTIPFGYSKGRTFSLSTREKLSKAKLLKSAV